MSEVKTDIAKKLNSIDELIAKLSIEKDLSLDKALKSGEVNEIFKAQQYYSQLSSKQQSTSKDGAKSMLLDPFDQAGSMGYFHKQTSLSFEALRGMAKTPVIRAIINTRKDQVSDFCKPQPDKYSKGFAIKKVGMEEDDDLSDNDQKMIKYLEKFIMNCGEDDVKYDRDTFVPFIKKIVEDSLVLDQTCFEIVPNRGFEPYSFLAVDGATFRIADYYSNDKVKEKGVKVNGYYPFYVQIWQGQVIREFYPWELCFGIRNPTTNIHASGYGRSELEDLITTVTAMLNADKYNGNFFRHGSAPKGALLVKKGNIDNDKIAQFKRDWNASMSGVDGAHKTPILDAESVEWLDLQKNNRDMEFSKFQEYLIKIACAVYKISPEEIGFTLQGSNGNGLGSKEGGKQEKDASKDKGLKPLLSTIAEWINKYIIGPKTKNQFEFSFVGLEVESAQEEEDRLSKAVTTYMEINEVRKARGLKPKKGYDMILNPIIAQMRMAEQQQQQQFGEQSQQQEKEDQENTNPFLDEPENDMQKGFSEWFNKEYELK